MTVDPRLQLTPGEYLIHPDGSASKVVDKRNMTVDEILATGKYTDRRGREWRNLHGDGRWLYVPDGQWFVSGKRILDMAYTSEMRLLIEREQHECPPGGMNYCLDHPAVNVLRSSENGAWFVFDRFEDVCSGPAYPTWREAMSAARALAVGE